MVGTRKERPLLFNVNRQLQECIALDLREFTVKRRNDLSDRLGSTSRRGDDIACNSATTTPILVRRAIDSLLGGGSRVDGGHKTLNDTEFLVDDFGKRSETVGCAGRVRDLHPI